MTFRTCAQSDLGRIRTVNEDFFLINAEERLYLIADGMGGHGHGEIASRIAAATIERYLQQNPLSALASLRQTIRTEAQRDRLRGALRAANQAVLDAVAADRSLDGMGCTAVAMLADGRRAYVAHVGDSRAYRWRDGALERLTEDHTWVHEQVAAGLLSEREARGHPFRSVVTRALGGGEELQAELCDVEVRRGDVYLLCSDGLTAVVPDERIEDSLRSAAGDLESCCRQLIAEANAHGGPDNVTILLLAG